MNAKLKRMWVNQPSTLQPDHHLHGTNVLVCPADTPVKGVVDVWFTSGDTVCQRMALLSLSPGWRPQPASPSLKGDLVKSRLKGDLAPA